MNLPIDKRIKKVLFTREELEKRISELAQWVNNEYSDSENLVIVGLMKGAIPFLAQLIKDVTVDHSLDFMIASSYEGEHGSSGNVKIIMDLAHPIHNKDVLIVEDIIDSGITLEKITGILKTRNPKSLKILTLLDKPYHRKANLKPYMYGFHCPDEFIVGFGLDYKEKMRNIPYIGVFDQTYLE